MAEKFYGHLTSVYRVIIVFTMIIMTHRELDDLGKMQLYVYVLLVLYAIGFSLLGKSKWVAYLELLVISIFIYRLDYQMMYFLYFLPYVQLISATANKLDLIAFPFLLTLFFYHQIDDQLIIAIIGFGLFISVMMFNFKFSQIHFLQKQVMVEKDNVKNIRIERQRLKQESEIMSGMFLRTKELYETLDEDIIKKQIVRSVRNFFNSHYSCLYQKKEEGGEYVIIEENGKNTKYDIEALLSDKEARVPVVKNDLMQIPIERKEGLDGEVIWGVLAIYGKRVEMTEGGQMAYFPFQEDDYELIMVYLMQAMQQIERIQLMNRNEYLANYDALTSIPNRRFFMEQFAFLIEQAKRGEDLSMLILDIDHFKTFNDTYGHQTGDDVLKLVADTLMEAVRKADFVGRLGGEEFAVLLPKSKGRAVEIAERIRKAVEKISLPEHIKQNITISIGVAHFGKDGTTIDELYNNADEALYVAKENGRNRVVEYQHINQLDVNYSEEELEERKKDREPIDVDIDYRLFSGEINEEEEDDYDYNYDDSDRYDYNDDYFRENYSDQDGKKPTYSSLNEKEVNENKEKQTKRKQYEDNIDFRFDYLGKEDGDE